MISKIFRTAILSILLLSLAALMFTTGWSKQVGAAPLLQPALQGGCPNDPYEPNNWFDQAASIPFDTEINGNICNSDDSDYFSFDLTAGQQVIIDLYNMELNSNLELYSPAQTLIAGSANAGPADEQIVYTAQDTGTYYVVVWGTEDELPNFYTLRVRLAATPSPTPTPTATPTPTSQPPTNTPTPTPTASPTPTPSLPSGTILHFGPDGTLLGALTTNGTPGDLATSLLGEVFVRINQNHRIVHYASSGQELGSWDVDGEAGEITVGPDGQVFVRINQNHRVVVFDPTGQWLGEIDTGVEVNDIAAASDGSLFASIGPQQRIVRFDANGQVAGGWNTPGEPDRVAITGDDWVAVRINQNHLSAQSTAQSPWLIAIYTSSGELISQIPVDAEPTGLAGSPDGSVFVTINQNHRILRYR